MASTAASSRATQSAGSIGGAAESTPPASATMTGAAAHGHGRRKWAKMLDRKPCIAPSRTRLRAVQTGPPRACAASKV